MLNRDSDYLFITTWYISVKINSRCPYLTPAFGIVFNISLTPYRVSCSAVSHLPPLRINIKIILRSSVRDFWVSAYFPAQRIFPSLALINLASKPTDAGFFIPIGPPSLSSYLVTTPVSIASPSGIAIKGTTITFLTPASSQLGTISVATYFVLQPAKKKMERTNTDKLNFNVFIYYPQSFLISSTLYPGSFPDETDRQIYYPYKQQM